jgi:asparagine synthase (glutamine-hydrolysing)
MCGINGILRLRVDSPAFDRGELLRTRDAMAARGPDGKGEWISRDGTVALGHRRLAIIDLSPAGAQPMTSGDGRFHIVFNGEIYNYRELRAELQRDGAHFRSSSDTEVILALFGREGVPGLARLRGMFALAIWDEADRTLLLGRDPLGIKPLYYAYDSATFRFASQVKALEAGGRISMRIDSAGLVGFLLWGSVPEPLTIRQGVRALPAGHVLRVRAGRMEEPRPLPGAEDPTPREGDDLGVAIAESVRAHLVADVPVAIFLSAGLDSSVVAAVARRALPEPPVAFTVRFRELIGTPLDEGPPAANLAGQLGLRHVASEVGREEFRDLWPRALAAMDQPSIDGFNTYVVSAMAAAAGLKVVLSGLGGDELLGSYPSFRDVPRITRWARWLARFPGAGRAWPTVTARLAPSRPKLQGLVRYGASLAGAYFLRRALFLPEELPALVGPEVATEGLAAYDPVAHAEHALPDAAVARDGWSVVHQLETAQYLRNQLLRDADWASMAHSVELRVPFVDARLRNVLLRSRGESARRPIKSDVARRVAAELPGAVLQRRKTGFYIPVMTWLGGNAPDASRGHGKASRALARRVLQAWGVPPR